jgi:hypothetical protein
MRIQCPACGTEVKTHRETEPDERVSCPHCGNSFPPARDSGDVGGQASPTATAIQLLSVLVILVGAAALAIYVYQMRERARNNDLGAGRDGPIRLAPPPAKGSELALGTHLGYLAPEIEGEDIDGRRFKLSDYRGKVVMLDFWGNW